MSAGIQFTWPGKLTKGEVLQSIPVDSVSYKTTKVCKGSDSSWTNQIYHGDNLSICRHLLQRYKSKIDLIYIDPPYGVGGKFFARKEGSKRRSAHAYYDPGLTHSSFDLSGLYARLVLMHELLSPRGTLYLQCDWRMSAVFRVLLDEVFGADRFLNHIIWTYKTGGISTKVGFAKKHDDILVYTKTSKPIFNPLKLKSYVPTLPEPHTPSGRKLGVRRDNNCELCQGQGPGQKYRMVYARDVWDDVPALFRNDREIVGYDTQKPIKLLERIIAASSEPGSIVADFYCGSGTTAVAASNLDRKWIVCDKGIAAISCTKKRTAALKCQRFGAELLISKS